MTVNHADGTRVESPFTLSDELFTKWATLAEEMMQLAGERLGFVLNEILEHKRHKEAHKEGRSLPHRRAAVDVKRKPAKKAKGHHHHMGEAHHKSKSGHGGVAPPSRDLNKWIK